MVCIVTMCLDHQSGGVARQGLVPAAHYPCDAQACIQHLVLIVSWWALFHQGTELPMKDNIVLNRRNIQG